MSKKSYEQLMNEALAAIPDTLDKREGSLIYTALAPMCLELAQCYDALENYQSLFFPDTSCGEYLSRIAEQFGISRKEAVPALRAASVVWSAGSEDNIPAGTRFFCGELLFTVKEKLGENLYSLECETAGKVGNTASEVLFPLEMLSGFVSAELGEILRMGTDREDDESLRSRFYRQAQAPSFGGNRSDYEEKTLSLDGVGAVKVFGAADAGAGNVKLILGGEDQRSVSAEFVQQVQNVFGSDEEGEGLAPLGHLVTVESCTDLPVNISAELTMESGVDREIVIEKVKTGLENFLLSVPFERSTVFLAQITANILETDGVLDVENLTLNGSAQNLSLQKGINSFEVPVPGTFTLN